MPPAAITIAAAMVKVRPPSPREVASVEPSVESLLDSSDDCSLDPSFEESEFSLESLELSLESPDAALESPEPSLESPLPSLEFDPWSDARELAGKSATRKHKMKRIYGQVRHGSGSGIKIVSVLTAYKDGGAVAVHEDRRRRSRIRPEPEHQPPDQRGRRGCEEPVAGPRPCASVALQVLCFLTRKPDDHPADDVRVELVDRLHHPNFSERSDAGERGCRDPERDRSD